MRYAVFLAIVFLTFQMFGFEYYSEVSTGGHYDSFVNKDSSHANLYLISKYFGEKEKKVFVFDLDGGIELKFLNNNQLSLEYFFSMDVPHNTEYAKLHHFMSFSFDSKARAFSYNLGASLHILNGDFSKFSLFHVTPSLNVDLLLKQNSFLTYFLSLNLNYAYGGSGDYRYRNGIFFESELGIELKNAIYLDSIGFSFDYGVFLFKDEAFIFSAETNNPVYYQRNRYQTFSVNIEVRKNIGSFDFSVVGRYSWFYWFDKDEYLEKEFGQKKHLVTVSSEVGYTFLEGLSLYGHYELEIDVSNMDKVFFQDVKYSYIRHKAGMFLSYVF